MGCKPGKGVVVPVNEQALPRTDKENDFYYDSSTIEDSISIQQNISSDDTIITKLIDTSDHIDFQVADPQAFNKSFVQQRQQAIDDRSYRVTIKSWKPNSLQQLVETIKTFSKGKSLVDRHWIIFYWVATNIEYDTVSYFSKDYKDQSAEGVFKNKKGVCAGYANIYKYLCDKLEMPCEVVSGYSKGYGFDDREGAPTETDHAWNAVEIDHHWYLMESTWGTGFLNEQKMFARELSSYYFLPRPNEMIYHHLSKEEKWQLLQTPIGMTQYMQMPKLRPLYFELNLELISPCNQAHVDLLPEKSYALVLIRAPSDVHLMATLKLKDQEIDGGHRIIFDKQKQIYRCYFAPATVGKHKITIYAKRGNTDVDKYSHALDLSLNVTQMPTNPISFPETWEKFFDLGLEVISPKNKHLIELNNGATHARIRIKTPEDVELLGLLKNEKGEEVKNGNRVYFDRRNNIWRCSFAPDRNGVFNAIIMAKRKTDPGSYTSAVSFKIDAKQIASPCLSYPYTWQSFYDLGLKIESPKKSSNAVWSDNASFAEILIKAPNNVQLSCNIKYNDVKVENGSLAQFDNNKKLWQLLFAPERTGLHELIVYAKRNNDNESSSNAVVKFDLDVTKLTRAMKFPLIYTQFVTKKCQIYTPMDGILKKGSVIPFHCVIPGATDVNLTVDSKGLESEGYKDPILQRQVSVGSKEVVICAKYGQKTDYDCLVKYTVQ